jgi:hypothetical protein
VATKSVLGVPEMRPALLDHIPYPARSRAGDTCTAIKADPLVGESRAMYFSPDIEDEDDEVFDDDDFEEGDASEEDLEDLDEDDQEEEETWQVAAS